jgi:hypothetical protein
MVERLSGFRRFRSVAPVSMSDFKTRSSTARVITSSPAVRDFSAGFMLTSLSG